MEQTSPVRKIIHIDMDAFYASVEQRDKPELKGKPIAVGGSRERGVVAAASYEARKFGVKSAMPSVTAARLCPDLIFIKPRFDQYKAVSQKIRAIFRDYTDLVEPLSLDEAYLDVTENKIGLPSATLIAQEIKKRVKDELNLIASAGISFNKFLAKIASDMDKPDGLYTILPKDSEEFVAKLPVQKFHGIGKKTAERMNHLGIFLGSDLRKLDLDEMIRRFGKSGKYFYNICRAIDHRVVEPNRERKSISAENTFDQDIKEILEVHEILERISKETFKRYERGREVGKTITIKVKYADFNQITRSRTTDNPILHQEELSKIAKELFHESLMQAQGIRLLGVGISNFIKEENKSGYQLTLDF
ncbi:MAG: DNA polymerase IV [Bacteroidota bacterium]